jgi:mRNA interferase RelE/StbE
VKLTPAARKQLHSIARKFLPKIIARINALATDPRPPGCKKLSGKLHMYRVRQGPYRVIYEIRDRDLLVIVIAVTDRKEAYR